METYDLDIENYKLDDILSLFHVTYDFTKMDLKGAYKIALKMHPDKSQLPQEYFIFFMKAYKLLCRIYDFRHRDEGRRPTYDTTLSNSEKLILENMNTKANVDASKFNKLFNEMFEKVKINDNEQDSGYESWFRDSSDKCDIQHVSLYQFDNEFEKKKQDCKDLVISKGLSEMGGDDGYDLMRDKPTSYAASIFSKLPYEDLKKAHTETVIPVTREDYTNKKKFSNVESYRSFRDSQNIEPPSLEQSKQFLAEKDKQSTEGDVHRVYSILKQDEEIHERNKQWWGYLKQIENE
jgi:hypothetical protein